MTVQPMVIRHREADPMLGNGTNLPAQIFVAIESRGFNSNIYWKHEAVRNGVIHQSLTYQIKAMVFMTLSCFLSKHVCRPIEMLGNSCEQFCPILYPSLRLRLHVPSTSPLFVPFKNGFSAVLCCCLHVTSNRSKMPLTKAVTLTVRVNKPLASWNCEYEPFQRSFENLSLDWWLVRVTLVVAFRFLPQSFGRWRAPTNCQFVQKRMQLQWCWQC